MHPKLIFSGKQTILTCAPYTIDKEVGHREMKWLSQVIHVARAQSQDWCAVFLIIVSMFFLIYWNVIHFRITNENKIFLENVMEKTPG
jgi:hypothetical protein